MKDGYNYKEGLFELGRHFWVFFGLGEHKEQRAKHTRDEHFRWKNMDKNFQNFENTRIIIYKGHREMGLVMALKFFPKKTSPGP